MLQRERLSYPQNLAADRCPFMQRIKVTYNSGQYFALSDGISPMKDLDE